MEPPLLMKPADAAAFLGIGTSTMRRLLAAGEIGAVRIGRSVRVLRAEAVRWANEREPVESRAPDIREPEPAA